MFISVISPKSRIIPEEQSPAHWRTWRNRGGDCVLMTSVWEFLVLPDVPWMLKQCDGKLCKMLRSIARKKRRLFSPKKFTKCAELARLLGYTGRDADGSNTYYGIRTMARLFLKLSYESDVIKERFKAYSELTRFCDVSASTFRQTNK